ncbi:hypothetical protein [Streptomyces sp. NBC_01217]|uniref:hypothetical protein n=1 Tax=Streptomyces sp. NBC_01217 TaxID=2903779 RepID=UPI002E10B413|nr:hypothetical protein OG507_00335 [Streptomyces sp. NBC_01217]WSQ62543.1 hypothetical protein OG507_39235 [Streptomyces sp. NBC_01217]
MPNPQQNHSGSTGAGDGDDPDAGKDLGNTVPTMSVGWDTPPSFNVDPGGQTGGQSASDVVDSGPIRFDAGTVRATENTLLAQSRNAVFNYEALRQKVDGAVHGQFWGPAAPPPPISSGQYTGGQTPGGTGWSPSPQESDDNDQRTLAEIGEEFARHINPAMQKALAMQSNSLELLGNFIAMINNAGQSYARVDRASRFPEPPGSVTG